MPPRDAVTPLRRLLLLASLLPCLVTLIACGSEPAAALLDDSAAWVIGGRGVDAGQFFRPRAVAVAEDGRIFVVDRSGRVQRLAPDGSPEVRWELPAWDNGTPTGMTLDADGNLWLADTHYARILVYSPEGELLRMWGESGAERGQMVFPTDIALDGRGHAYVTEYGGRVRVMKFTEAGEFIDEWNPRDPETDDELLMRPMALVWEESRGDLLVADSCHHRLVRMSPEGEILQVIGREGTAPGEFRYPYDVSLGPEGEIYVCEYENARVQRLSSEGVCERIWGERGRRAGQLWSPWGVALRPDGALVVADTDNHRLQVFGQ